MVIRRQQMQVFSDYSLRQFELRMAAHLAAAFPHHAAALPPDELHSLVRTAITSAQAHGIEYEDELRRFLELAIVYGPGLEDAAPWAAPILASGEPGAIKIAQLEEQHRLHPAKTMAAG